jgi:hypothetical protein
MNWKECGKKAIMPFFEVLSRQLLGEDEENHETPQDSTYLG